MDAMLASIEAFERAFAISFRPAQKIDAEGETAGVAGVKVEFAAQVTGLPSVASGVK